MHLRQAKGYVGLRVTAKLYQFVCCWHVIQVSKTCTHEFAFGFYAGVFVEIIIRTEIVFIQQQVHLFASLAAKRFIIGFYNFFTLFPAMEAAYCYIGFRFYTFLFQRVKNERYKIGLSFF
jgi:hypothetical protein